MGVTISNGTWGTRHKIKDNFRLKLYCGDVAGKAKKKRGTARV